MVPLHRVKDKISIYTYPKSESDPIKFHESLIEQSWMPQTIIFKIMDVNNKEIKPKIPIPKKMISAFPKESFNYAYLINISNKTELSTDDADLIYKTIVDILKELKTKPQSFMIDAEPIIDPSNENYNTMDFHTQLISLINAGLKLPVSMYFNPSILAHPRLKTSSKKGFNELMTTLRKNKENNVHLAAYEKILTERILESIEILENEKVDYQIIVKISEKKVLEERLELISKYKLSRSGLVLYKLGSEDLIPKESMKLVEKYYD